MAPIRAPEAAPGLACRSMLRTARRNMCSTAPAIVQEGPDALRHGEHPLAHGKRRKDVIDEMGCGLDHAAGVAGRTHAAALATEGS